MTTPSHDPAAQYREVEHAAKTALYRLDELPLLLYGLDSRLLQHIKKLGQHLEAATSRELTRRRFNEIWLAAGANPTPPSRPDPPSPPPRRSSREGSREPSRESPAPSPAPSADTHRGDWT